MKIGLISTAVPLVQGGARFIVDWLQEELTARGHLVEAIYLPYTDEQDHVLPQMAAMRTIKLDAYFDRVITFRPPAHMVQHPFKVVWFIHHLRYLYDLWQTPYCPIPDDPAGRAFRGAVLRADQTALREAHRLFTNSATVRTRVKRFNGLDSEVLYPPIRRPERFRSGPYGNEIVSVCRMEHHKRQHLLIEALARTETPVRLRLCGLSVDPGYVDGLRSLAAALGVAERVTVEDRWISEDDKVDRLETALASAYVPYDEDSYGYPTLEAAHARRCTLTVSDSGGVPEFIADGFSGFITAPEANALAKTMDRLFWDRDLAGRMGAVAQARISELGINWDAVIGKLLA